ncbi:unnamed protein product [Ostreobium quekettii]|uniref:Uncharacterized protein n=1 Tax=Ostreobium quekettii TaxID=121088 RepID=A0A8S1JD15_9CHLO|nr:unnamed protein product [Ostreobium quekettii]
MIGTRRRFKGAGRLKCLWQVKGGNGHAPVAALYVIGPKPCKTNQPTIPKPNHESVATGDGRRVVTLGRLGLWMWRTGGCSGLQDRPTWGQQAAVRSGKGGCECVANGNGLLCVGTFNLQQRVRGDGL